jgi:hypothetical protein
MIEATHGLSATSVPAAGRKGPAFLRNRINGAVYPYHPAIERLPHIEPFYGAPTQTLPDREAPVPTAEHPAAWQATPREGVDVTAPASAPPVEPVPPAEAAPPGAPTPFETVPVSAQPPVQLGFPELPAVTLGSFDGGDP